MNSTSGFHLVSCTSKPCEPFNATACDAHGGNEVPTDDGCCTKCDNKCIAKDGAVHPVLYTIFAVKNTFEIK